MNKVLLEQALSLLKDITPLQFDCGCLCGHACCLSVQGGMLAFPQEKEVSSLPVVDEFLLPGFGKVAILDCGGTCDRDHRPLACRIFPLAPKQKRDGSFTTVLDDRGKPVCPLCRGKMAALSNEFIQAVQQVFHLLAEDEEGRRYLSALSDLIAGYHTLTLP